MAETEIKASTPIAGTNLAAAIVPFTTADTYPTHEARYGKGGYHSVQERADRDAIPKERREIGMAVYVYEENEVYILGERLTNDDWRVVEFGYSIAELEGHFYSKQEVDEKIDATESLVQDVDDKVKALGAVLSYKGAKANKAALPTTGNKQGDVWHVTDDSAEYVWNGTAWEALGTTVDLSGKADKDHTHTVNDIYDLYEYAKQYEGAILADIHFDADIPVSIQFDIQDLLRMFGVDSGSGYKGIARNGLSDYLKQAPVICGIGDGIDDFRVMTFYYKQGNNLLTLTFHAYHNDQEYLLNVNLVNDYDKTEWTIQKGASALDIQSIPTSVIEALK